MLLAGIPQKRCCILPSAPSVLLWDFPVHKLPVEIKEDNPAENRACYSELARAGGQLPLLHLAETQGRQGRGGFL